MRSGCGHKKARGRAGPTGQRNFAPLQHTPVTHLNSDSKLLTKAEMGHCSQASHHFLYKYYLMRERIKTTRKHNIRRNASTSETKSSESAHPQIPSSAESSERLGLKPPFLVSTGPNPLLRIWWELRERHCTHT